MSKKIEIEQLHHGWLLTVKDDLQSEVSAYENPANLLMGIAAALSGGATRVNSEDKDFITIQCRKFK